MRLVVDCWIVKERSPTRSSNIVDSVIDDIEVYEIKSPNWESKINPYIISQVKPASSQQYHH